MRIKLLKLVNEMRGRMLPISIMVLMLFMNAFLTVLALEEIPEKEPIEINEPEMVNVYDDPMKFIEDAVTGKICTASAVVNIEDPTEVYRIIEERQRLEEANRIAEEKRRAEEEARLTEERRIAEEKRKAEEAERRRVDQIKSIKLSKDITVSANLTIEQITYMLKDTGLAGTEWAFYKLQQEKGLNVIVCASISINEAGWKTNSHRARYNNNIYGITTGKQSFNSKQDCIYYFADFMQRLYINQGLTTLGEIQPKYCPPYSLWDDDVWSIAKRLHSRVVSKYKI